jgi:hypothetical protein
MAATDRFRGDAALQGDHPATSATHPWARYFARLLDTSFFSFFFFFVLGVTFPSLFTSTGGKDTQRSLENLYGIAGLLAYVPFEAFCMNIFGTTLSKAL